VQQHIHAYRDTTSKQKSVNEVQKKLPIQAMIKLSFLVEGFK
jgi:hypothetical protein